MSKKFGLGVMFAAVTGFLPLAAFAADPVTLEV